MIDGKTNIKEDKKNENIVANEAKNKNFIVTNVFMGNENLKDYLVNILNKKSTA